MPAGKDVFVRPSNIKTEEKKKKQSQLPKDIVEEKDRKDDMEATKLNPNKCLINIPSAELKNIEREFWARIDVSGAIFVGGSLGKKKAGVSAFALSNNSRLVALGLNNGQILVYDMIYQNKPQLNGDNLEDSEGELLLIRFVTGLKAAVTHIEFSSD